MAIVMAAGRKVVKQSLIFCAAVLSLHGAIYYMTLYRHEHRSKTNYERNVWSVASPAVIGTPDDKASHWTAERSSQGYILVVDYKQQLTAGFLGFYHLATIAALLNLSVVEPYIQGTGLQGAPHIRKNSDPQVLKLSHFYDLAHLEDALMTCTNSHLVSFEEFLTNASRNVVLVSFLHSLKFFGYYFSAGNESRKIVEIDNATNSQLSGLKTLNLWASFVREKSMSPLTFSKSRAVLVDARPLHPLPLSDLVQYLGSIVQEQVAKYGSATIVLDRWRDIQLNSPSAYLYYIQGFQYKDCADIDTVKHSKIITSAAEQFKVSLGGSHPIVGVHIRAERLLLDFKGSESHYKRCLRQLLHLMNNGTIANIRHGSMHIFHDLGEYGSSTCNVREWKYCIEGRKNFLTELNRYFKKFVVSFDPSSFHPVTLQPAFASFVEREYLSTVDVLVTVGRGGYQDSIVKRFLKRSGGTSDSLYRICNNPPPLPECYPNC